MDSKLRVSEKEKKNVKGSNLFRRLLDKNNLIKQKSDI